jgi:glycosyltransferase involved in cell wall biosynthesis
MVADGIDVAVDARGLADASAFRGIGTYLRGLLPPLADQAGIRVTALVSGSVELPTTIARHEVRRRAPGRFATAEHELLLPRDLRRLSVDVVHSPALDPPRRCPVPVVQTLHDVIPLVVDAPGLAVERRRWRRYAPRIRQAAAVIAVSQHCADQGIAALDLDHRRVHVIHHGVAEVFRPDGDRETGEDPYVLYVGEYDPRKGYAEAFEVIGRVAEAGLPHRLLVVGRVAPWVADEVRGLVAAAPRPERIELLGFVTTARLAALYRGAAVVAITSRHEGFGLPAAEAMASGAPVVGFANTAIREVIAEGGSLIDDGDVPAFAQAVIGILTDDRRRAEAVERALTRARRFSWAQSAAAHAHVFRSVAGA